MPRASTVCAFESSAIWIPGLTRPELEPFARAVDLEDGAQGKRQDGERGDDASDPQRLPVGVERDEWQMTTLSVDSVLRFLLLAITAAVLGAATAEAVNIVKTGDTAIASFDDAASFAYP
jgi:hypothetical protein